MDKIEEVMEKAMKIQRDEAEKASAEEENKVNIGRDGYIAKEIIYQTAILHRIMREIREIKEEMNKGQHKPPRKRLLIFKAKR